MSESHSGPVGLESIPKETAVEKSASASTPPPQLDGQPEVAQPQVNPTPPTPPVEADNHDIEAEDVRFLTH